MYGDYTCLDCGRTFDVPHRWTERHGFISPPYERNSCCPYCGGDYARTILCDGCGEPITGDYVQIEIAGKRYCDQCFLMRSLDENEKG